jgi:hypothetical protein
VNTPTREDLLGFILGALDTSEHQQVADCLDRHPELRLEIEQIQAALAPLETCRDSGDYPAGLARRTCEVIARKTRDIHCPSHATVARAACSAPRPATSAKRFSRRSQVVQSALMVFCASCLGAAIGPLAYGAISNGASVPPASLAAQSTAPQGSVERLPNSSLASTRVSTEISPISLRGQNEFRPQRFPSVSAFSGRGAPVRLFVPTSLSQ